MILPNLAERVAWYQERLRPESPEFGNGIADWTITAEYRDNLKSASGPPDNRQEWEVWGVMCSPGNEAIALTPEDIQAKRAKILIRTPKTPAELAEVDRTLLHELGHVLVAPMGSTNRDAEENAMHSLDTFFSKLSADESQALARGMQTPMARAYRAPAKEGDMPDPNENDKDKENKEPPKAAEGTSGDIDGAAVADILAKQDGPAALAWLAKLAGRAVDAALPTGETAAPTPAEPQPETMGMKPEDAYARKIEDAKKEANKEAIEAIVEANPHLTDKQKAMARKQPTAKDARELVETYKRPEVATMGMTTKPQASGANAPTVRQKALQASPEVLARVNRAASNEDTAGLHLDVPGHILAWSPAGWLKEQYGAFKRAQVKGAA